MTYDEAYIALERALTAVETFYDSTVLSGTECDQLIDAILREMMRITTEQLASTNDQYRALTEPFKAQKAKLDRIAAKAAELEGVLIKANEIVALFRSLSGGIPG